MIYDSTNTPLCLWLKSSRQGSEPVKIANRTLDGKYHYQTIGEAVKTFEVEVYVDDDLLEALLDAEATGEVIKLTRDTKYYTGMIKDTPIAQTHIATDPKIYIASFTLTVDNEGAV